MKLKTLKNMGTEVLVLETEEDSITQYDGSLKIVARIKCPDIFISQPIDKLKIHTDYDLKQEAIKDIKILSKDYRELDDKFFANFQSRETIAYIKWKFNITEEDLK